MPHPIFFGRVLIDPTPSPKNLIWVSSSSSLQKAPPILLPKCQSSASYLERVCQNIFLLFPEFETGGGGGGRLYFSSPGMSSFSCTRTWDDGLMCREICGGEEILFVFVEWFFLLPEGSILQHQILPKSLSLIYTV